MYHVVPTIILYFTLLDPLVWIATFNMIP